MTTRADYERDVLEVVDVYRFPVTEATILTHYFDWEAPAVRVALSTLTSHGRLEVVGGMYRAVSP